MEEIKKELQNISDGLEKKLKSQIDTVSEQIDSLVEKGRAETENNDKMHQETKNALDSLTATHKGLQEQLDAIETATKRNSGAEKAEKSFRGQIFKAFNDESFVSKLNAKVPFDLELKASDMTSSNTFTNDVFEVDRNPAIIYNPDRAVHVRSLLPNGVMSGNSFEYIQETAYDSGAAAVAEGGTAPQSDFDLTQQTAPAVKINTFLVVTEEMLADVPAMASYISTRVPSKIRVAEDNQILYGTGVSPQMTGITVSASAYTDNLADSNITRWDVLRDAIRQVRDDEYFANGILLHPTDFALLELEKDTQGRYILPSMLTGDVPSISGVPIFENTAITAGDFLVGDWMQGASVFDRQQSFIRFYDQDSTNVRTGDITVKAQERLALPIWRSSAFIYGTFASALAQGSA